MKGGKMNSKLAFYEALNNYLTTNQWQALVKNRFIAVEIPETKEMYYITVEVLDSKNNNIAIAIMKGDLGLNYLMESLDDQLMPLDYMKRSHLIGIGFSDSLESLPEIFIEESFKEKRLEMYETFGYPFIYFKGKGVLAQPVDES